MRRFVWIVSDDTSEDYLYEIVDRCLEFRIGGDWYHHKAKSKIEGYFYSHNGIEYDVIEINVRFTSEDEDIYLQDTDISLDDNMLIFKTVDGKIYSTMV